MIRTEGLTKKFGTFTAVDGLTFQVNKGEVFGLLGPNGAGKTTTIRMLCCLISKTGGTARIGDYDISDAREAMKIRKMIGIVHDNVGLYESLSPYENLEFYGRMYEFQESRLRENIEKYLKALDLWDNKDKPVGSFSKGMKQKVAIARSLVHEPELLFMDEPTANLDPEASKVIRDIILDLKKENRTIFLNTHNLDEAQRICDRIGVLKTKIMAVDTPVNLERAMARKKTVFVLEVVSEKVLTAVKAGNPESVEVKGDSIILELADPDKETSAIVNSIIAAGGKIKSVTERGASLEDVYMKLVRG
ncbi:MAG: multidrug ABC transporter ATP-binding protein [Thermoplasmatales archaeon B_DKE]|nr:MAG: multidrug ABC transporter ATP-binding protein [Thermoplasmatales archaeon B_DKE]